MKRLGKIAMIVLGFLVALPVYAGTVTLVGTVNEEFQLVTPSGQVYEIAATAEGDEVAMLTGTQVKVTGEVEEVDGDMIITVTGFDIPGDAAPEQEDEEY